jgi:hypothetical protein
MRPTARAALLVGVGSVAAGHAGAQSWRLRLDASAQHIEFRALTSDSIPAAAAVVNAAGGLQSPDGFAVDCIGDGYCRFFRPGAVLSGLPASAGIDLTLWGLGVTGLSVRMNARALTDLSGGSVFSGTTPTLEVLEGYAEYLHSGLTVQVGRTLERGRLASVGSSGLDGVRATWRPDSSVFEFGGYAGWGTARGTILGVNSPAVDPLADYQPASRQIVVGALAGVHLLAVDVQAEYRRELDPVTDYIVAERAALSVQGTPAPRIRLIAGADYDIAQAEWGSAEITGNYTGVNVTASLTAQHYRPFFDLSTVWGVFSPVPYNGITAAIAVNPLKTLQLRSRSEWFRYDAAGVSVPAVPLQDHGWRWALEGTWSPVGRWSAELDTHGDLEPGASSSGIDGRVTWRRNAALDLSIDGGNLEEPLELRFQNANLNYVGGSAAYRIAERWRVDASLDRYWGAQNRADASTFDLNQWRMSARVSLTLRSSADRWLPPAQPLGRSP